MASISIAKLNFSMAAGCRTTLPSSAAKLECFNGAWLSSRKQLLSIFHPIFHQQQISNVINSRVASLDTAEVSEKDDSKAEVIEMVDDELRGSVEYIRTLLNTMDDGRISVSPYDTAFVALIKDIKGGEGPQFPSALEWIAQNQLPDGSWGDEHHFCAYDRLVNSLACVVALRSWNVHPLMCEKGISYINEKVDQLRNADAEHMTCGFEVIFPALLQRTRKLGIDDLPYDAPVITEIYNARDQKLKRIPKEMMYKVPTSLLFSLEGFEDLDWEKLLKLQSVDGSFLTSPSSTAFAFMETQDENCLRFITNTVQKLDGAPHTYPVDVFARLWAVDRLQRLGVSRYFESEINDILGYIYRCWNPTKGLFSGRDSEFCDIDDTSMAFRLLRLHGYDVDPSVMENFKSGSKFSCYGGQIIESSSPIYNLYRASQLQYPGENILEEARDFSYNFLQEKLASNQLLDKWVISKHLPDEIRKGLEMPWYSVLPRVEARYYLQYYAGGDDVWIGKTLYRMEEISNNTYLELARSDFQKCQIQHQIEWFSMQEWYGNSNLQELRISRKDLLVAYFLAASSIFEPERSRERVAWAKSQIICRVIKSFFNETTTLLEQKTSLLKQFESINGHSPRRLHEAEDHGPVNILLQFLVGFNRHINKQLKAAWGKWLMKLKQGDANLWEDAELLVMTLNIFAGYTALNEDMLSHHEYKALSNLTNKICQHLSQVQSKKTLDWEDRKATISSLKEVEHGMQALVKLVLEESGGLNRNIKQAFLSVVKSYYYSAYNDAETIDAHIFKVLFEPVA